MTPARWALIAAVCSVELGAIVLSKIHLGMFMYGYTFSVCLTGILVLFFRPRYAKITLGFLLCYLLSALMMDSWRQVCWSYTALWAASLFLGSYTRYSLENVVGNISLVHVAAALVVVERFGDLATLNDPRVYGIAQLVDVVLLVQIFIFCGYVVLNKHKDVRPANVVDIGRTNAQRETEHSRAVGAH